MSFRWAGASETGQVRSANQDRWYATDGLFVVADGMGGHQGGEVASTVAIETMRDRMATGGDVVDTRLLLDGMQAANRAVLARADSAPELRGMGTTLCAVAAVEGPDPDRSWVAVANVGDSRVYLWAGNELRQVTRDHSLVEDMVREGRLTADEAEVHPQRNILTRALGVAPDIDIDYWEMPARDGDRFLLCSDGLFNEVTLDQIASVLRRLTDPRDVADELVRLADAAGGRDNITVVVADVQSAGGSTEERVIGAPKVSHDRGIPERLLDPGIEPVDAVTDLQHSGTPVRTLTWVLAVLAVMTVAVGAVGLYARSSYFVGVDGDSVVIYQGRPGGVLWFDPTIEVITDVEVADLTPLLLEEVQGHPDYASIEGAHNYVENLIERLDIAAPEPE